MLVSLNWLRDFVDVPASVDPVALAERFTLVCAEVEGVERIEVGAEGLIAAQIISHRSLPQTKGLKAVELDLGSGQTATTVTSAAVLRDGGLVVYAPPGARTKADGTLGEATVAGVTSSGMILSGESLGMPLVAAEAVYCPPPMKAGDAIDPGLFDDWIIEIDNKSITHRPDLWGHYGVARELAAMLHAPLKPYPVVDEQSLADASLPEIPIEIDDPARCPRYTGLRMTGVVNQPSPLWMQARLGRVGMRPIDCLVDLTNYIMAELGQPMHAFDGDRVERIEVGLAKSGSKFTTLDGIERKLPEQALMILSSRKPVAIAGIMGGLETEVSSGTRSLLLESASFEPAGIRRCAAALGLRTEASARFEKSLDPGYTVLAVQRFVQLARTEFPEFAPISRLSDCFPNPPLPVRIEVDPASVNRCLGHAIDAAGMESILKAMEFGVTRSNGRLVVDVPSFRATKDISIEADVIEEIARYVGYDNIAAELPHVQMRYFEPNAEHRLERRTLETFCRGLNFSEVHLYIWYDAAWCRQLGYERFDTVALRNPIAEGQEHLRATLMPGLLQAADRNRRHLDSFKLCEIGSVFAGGADSQKQWRRLGLVCAQRGKGVEDGLLAELKGAIEVWARRVLGVSCEYDPAEKADLPWEHGEKSARVRISGQPVGTVGVVPLSVRRAMDEHWVAWGIAYAEIDLEPLLGVTPEDDRLANVPQYPEVDLDFSILVDARLRYGQVRETLSRFEHGLLRRLTYVGAYEGKSIPDGRRSLTFRSRIGAGDRTLADADLAAFRESFETFIGRCGYELRKG